MESAELRLTEIWIYPVKGLRGIRLRSSRVLGKGLEFDRRYMLIDDNGVAMTQRKYPTMALFQTAITNGYISIAYGPHAIEVPATPPVTNGSMKAAVWDDIVMVEEVSEECSHWFSTHLGVQCKLVFFPENESRPVDPEYQINHENVSLADAYPILIIGQSSLDDLNARLEASVPMNRFRPNFVFEGGAPYAEDQWKFFRIGNSYFTGVKPCARCMVPTVNQETAEKGTEPIRTLSSYRSSNNKVYFGQNAMVLKGEHVSEGDTLELIDHPGKP